MTGEADPQMLTLTRIRQSILGGGGGHGSREQFSSTPPTQKQTQKQLHSSTSIHLLGWEHAPPQKNPSHYAFASGINGMFCMNLGGHVGERLWQDMNSFPPRANE